MHTLGIVVKVDLPNGENKEIRSLLSEHASLLLATRSGRSYRRRLA